MQTLADKIIDALGGTTAVSRLIDAPLSTVHSWRTNGIPRSRLAHMRLAAASERPDVDIDAIIAAYESGESIESPPPFPPAPQGADLPAQPQPNPPREKPVADSTDGATSSRTSSPRRSTASEGASAEVRAA